jgi:F0F1-type ATP synthase assembly protein I
MFKIFEKITELIGWLQIAISPTLLGFGIGCIVYYNFQNSTGLILGIVISIIGLICGIVLATNKFKTTGTVQFLSRVSAAPELDKTTETESGEK